jgi:FeS assembly SUF system regulator
MLKLTKRADYGLIALRHLVEGDKPSATAKEIAETYGIPLALLAKVLQKLTRSGLLASEQGVYGGYRLARDPSRITALEIIQTIDGPVLLTACLTEHGHCDQSERCNVRAPLKKVHEGILNLLRNISLLDMSEDKIPEVPLAEVAPWVNLRPSV